MDILRISAFSQNGVGGNPAGVVIEPELPDAADMQRIAREVGYSETAFACPAGAAWRVRYFAPESEVPFCGHATIALGAALAMKNGSGVFDLTLNEAKITVEGQAEGDILHAALQSPPTRSAPLDDGVLAEALELFGYSQDDLDPALPPRWVHGGADHIALSLKSRSALADMQYDLETGRALMNREGWVTIVLAYADSKTTFHTRNPFASGGVYEDPATGAATAAFAGYLRDIQWPHSGSIAIIQGEDMGARSCLHANFSDIAGSSVRVSGQAHIMA